MEKQEQFTVLMPDIGEGVVEGEVTAWLQEEGATLQQDTPVIELMTDKATVELPAPYPGTLSKCYYAVGDTAIKGKPLYDITLAPGTKVAKQAEKTQKKPKQPKKSNTDSKESKSTSATPTTEKALATPPVRRLAKQLGIDIHKIKGTGKNGRVTAEDVRTSLSGSLSSAPATSTRFPELQDDTIVPLQGVRRLVAAQMALSKQRIPHFSLSDKADASLLVKFRTKNKELAEAEGLSLTFVPLFLRALSLTIQRFPEINASLDDERNIIIYHKVQNMGIAMKSENGLIVPVLKGVEGMDLEQIIRSYTELRNKMVNKKLKPSDMKEGTITLSNFGTEGGLWATPVINYPEAAILATARIRKQPTEKTGQIVLRDILNVSWSFDHRLIDGDLAAAVSNYFIKLIETPSQLI